MFSDGSLLAYYDINGSISGEGVYQDFRASDSLGIGTTGSQIIDISRSFDHTFTAADIGSTLTVNMQLNTFAGPLLGADTAASDTATAAASGDTNGNRIAYADFGNSGEFGFTGTAIAPAAVPVPAAVWLLGSALMGLVAIRRRPKV